MVPCERALIKQQAGTVIYCFRCARPCSRCSVSSCSSHATSVGVPEPPRCAPEATMSTAVVHTQASQLCRVCADLSPTGCGSTKDRGRLGYQGGHTLETKSGILEVNTTGVRHLCMRISCTFGLNGNKLSETLKAEEQSH